MCVPCLCVCTHECVCELMPAFLNTGSGVFTIPVIVPQQRTLCLLVCGARWLRRFQRWPLAKAHSVYLRSSWVWAPGAPAAAGSPADGLGFPGRLKWESGCARRFQGHCQRDPAHPPSPFGPLLCAQALWYLSSINTTFSQLLLPLISRGSKYCASALGEPRPGEVGLQCGSDCLFPGGGYLASATQRGLWILSLR